MNRKSANHFRAWWIGIAREYAYGKRLNKDDSSLDNHGIAVGMQFY